MNSKDKNWMISDIDILYKVYLVSSDKQLYQSILTF